MDNVHAPIIIIKLDCLAYLIISACGNFLCVELSGWNHHLHDFRLLMQYQALEPISYFSCSVVTV